jgi:hypothetical protein
MRTTNQIISFTKNQISQKWEFMVLDSDTPQSEYSCISIDPSLSSLSVANKTTLSSYDLRKFNKLSEYKISSVVTQLNQRDDGYMTIVTPDAKVCMCKEIQGEIKSLIEFPSKNPLGIPQHVEIVYDLGRDS